jgi:ATP phosphoribosyltransferase
MSPIVASATRDRLRIAIQKSGRLAEPARALLSACGLSWRESRDKLFCYGESLPVDLLLVRDDDIPGLIADGVCDFGVVGRNELNEQAAARARLGLSDAYREMHALGFGGCRLMLAIPETWDWQGPTQLEGMRIATSYPAILGDWLEKQGVRASVVELSGSVEIAPKLGTADLICDLVSSGATLLANQLKPVETLLESEAVLAGPARELEDQRADLAAMLLRRMEGVLKLKDSKLLMFRADRDTVPALLRLLPDADPPTYLAAETGGPLSLQTMCHGLVTWQRLEELERAGAQGLMVLSVERSLA